MIRPRISTLRITKPVAWAAALWLAWGMPTLAATAEKIVFTSDRGGDSDIWMMNPDGSEIEQLTTGSASDSHPVLSPDGTLLAFTSDREADGPEDSDIWVMDMQDKTLVNLTSGNPLSDHSPTWSPDGAQIAFTSSRGGYTSIWRTATSGGIATQVTFPTQTAPAEGDLWPDWSPDGNKILFMSTQGHRDLWAVWEVSLTTGTERKIIERFGGNEYAPAYSPDGKKIAWSHFPSSPSTPANIWVANADGSSRRAVTTGNFDEAGSSWSVDGTRIVFQSNRKGNQHIWSVKSDGTGLTQLTSGNSNNTYPDWGIVVLPDLPEDGVWSSRAPTLTPRSAIIVQAVGGFIYAGQGVGAGFQGLFDRYDPASDIWTERRIPSDAYGRASAAVNGRIYAFGGVEHAGPLTKVDMYNPTTGSWAARANMRTPRTGPAAAVVNGKVFVFGGSDAFGSTTGTTSTEMYDPATNRWIRRAVMPRPRVSPNAETVDGKIYVFGGHSGSTTYDIVDVYDPAANTWKTLSTRMPRPRDGAASVVLRGKILLLGGYNRTEGTLASVEAFDPSSGSWSEREAMPTARSSLGACVVDDLVYVIGGESSEGYLDVVEVYDETKDPALDNPLDVDNDGSVSVSDAIAVLQVALGEAPMTSRADVNDDGSVDALDALLVLQGLPTAKVVVGSGSSEAGLTLVLLPSEDPEYMEVVVRLHGISLAQGYALRLVYNPGAVEAIGGLTSVSRPGEIILADLMRPIERVEGMQELARLRFRVIDKTLASRMEIAETIFFDASGRATGAIGTQLMGSHLQPAEYFLAQNYPNPFNPSTTIHYSLPEKSTVRLVVYNAMGQEVKTLVHTVQKAGVYSIDWNGRDEQGQPVGSGIYLYRLVNNDRVETRRMLLIK